MNYSKDDLIEFGKRLKDWGCTIPYDILDCAADEHLKETWIDTGFCKHENKYVHSSDGREYCPNCMNFLFDGLVCHHPIMFREYFSDTNYKCTRCGQIKF